MKTLIRITSAIFILSASLIAQSSLLVTNLSNGSMVISNNAIIYEGAAPLSMGTVDLNIKNTSATTKTYKIRKFDDLLNTGAAAYFCFGAQCFSSSTYTSITNQTLLAYQDVVSISTQTANYIVNLHFDEAAAVGMSDIRYQIYDINNLTDIFTLTIKYNNPASVKNHLTLFSSVSDVYPNPSSTKAMLNISSQADIQTSVTIHNTLGSIVSTKNVDLSVGKNTVNLETEHLNSGIYFVTIANGSAKIVKKFTVNN